MATSAPTLRKTVDGFKPARPVKVTKPVAAKVKPAPAPAPKRPGRFVTVLAILFCMGGVVAISQLFLIHMSVRLDESQSLWQTSHTYSGVLQVVGKDVHVPLYHMILHTWQIFFGQSIEAARTLSMVFFLAAIPSFFLLARLHLERKWALLATFLFSFSPFMNWYANETRMYTLLVLVAILSQYFFTRIIQRKSGWLGYTLTAMVGIYVHYFFFFGLAAQGLFYLLNRKHFAKGTFKRFAGLVVLLLVEFLPWLLFFRSLGSGDDTRPLLTTPSFVDMFNVFSNFAFGFQTDYVNTILVSSWPLLVIVALMFVKSKQRLEQPMAYMLAAGILPVVLAFVVSSFIQPFFLSRYMVACLPPLIIVSVWLVSQYQRALYRLLIFIFLIVVTVSSYLQISNPLTPVKEDYQAAAQSITAQASPRDVVVLSTPFLIYPFEKVYSGPAQVQTLPIWDRRSENGIPSFNAAQLGNQVNTINEGHRYVYLVLGYDQGYQEDIYQYYVQRFKLVEKKQFSNDLMMYKFQISYYEPPALSELPADQKIR